MCLLLLDQVKINLEKLIMEVKMSCQRYTVAPNSLLYKNCYINEKKLFIAVIHSKNYFLNFLLNKYFVVKCV